MHEHADDRNGQIGWELQKQTTDRVTGIVTLHSRAIRNNIGHAHAILRLASFRQTSVALFGYFCTSTTGILLPLGRKCVHQRYLIDSSVSGLARVYCFLLKGQIAPSFWTFSSTFTRQLMGAVCYSNYGSHLERQKLYFEIDHARRISLMTVRLKN